MDRNPPAADLLDYGVRVQNAQDVAQLRWLIAQVDAALVRLTAARMTTRRAPRPHQVIAELGLERRAHARNDPTPLQRLRAHDLGRERGWHASSRHASQARAAGDTAR